MAVSRTNTIQILHSPTDESASPANAAAGGLTLAKGEFAWQDQGVGGGDGKLWIGDATGGGAVERHIGGCGDGAVAGDASNLTGTTLAAGVVSTSITSLGTLTSLGTGAITGTGATNAFSSSTASSPLMTITNTANDATAPIIRFANDKAAAGAAGDDAGSIEFYADNAAQQQTAYGKILTEIGTLGHADGDEAGKMSLFVAESDGSTSQLTAGLVLQGEEGTDGQVDVWIGAGSGSTTTIAGDLTVSGTTTTVDSTTVATGDSMIKLAKDQGTSADAIDFGLYGVYGVGGTAKYAGIFRDASATGDPWTFYDSLQTDPTTTVDIGGTGYDLADISAGAITSADGFTGNLTGTASALTNATLTTALTVNTGTLTLTANSSNNSVLTIGAGGVSVSGSNTGDQDTVDMGDGFTVAATTNTAASTITEGDTLTIAAGTGITTVATSDGVITINSSVSDTNTVDMGDGFTVAATTTGTGTTITEGDSLTLTAGTGITTTGTSDGVVTIACTVSDTNTVDMGDGFTIDCDSGSDLTITEGNTMTVVGGVNCASAASATDTVTINVDTAPTFTGAAGVTINDATASSATEGGNLVLASNDGAVMASGHRLGVIEFKGAEDTGDTYTVGARIEALTDATWSSSENGADLVFYTTDGNAAQAESVRIFSDKTSGVRIHNTTTSSATEGGKLRLSADDGAVMASGHRLGVIEFAGAEDTSNTLTIGARIEATTDAAWTASENGASLEFYTTDGNASEGIALTLDSDQKATFAGAVAMNAVVTIGDGGDTVAINSSDWDISTTGTITNAVLAGGTF